MRFLITGVAGFVGSTLARNLIRDYPDIEICGIDNLSYGYRERIADLLTKMSFIEGDVADLRHLLRGKIFDVIVHCTAIAPLPDNQIDCHRAIVQNVANCGSVADFALDAGVRDIVFFSSGAIYEGLAVYPTPESIIPNPRLVYPTTKYMAEIFFQSLCASHDINLTAIRLFNLYGPHQDYFRKQPPLIGYLLRSILENNEVTLFSSGDQCRDYIYIDDLVQLVFAASNFMKNQPSGGRFTAVNAGSGFPISVNEIIDMLETISQTKLKIKRLPSEKYWDKYSELFERAISIKRDIIKAEVEKHTHADIRSAKELLGWAPTISMQSGLTKCLDYAKTIILK